MAWRRSFLCGMAVGMLGTAALFWLDGSSAPIRAVPAKLMPTQWSPPLNPSLPRSLARPPATQPLPFGLFPGDYRIPTTLPKTFLDNAQPFFFNGQRVDLLPLFGHPSVASNTSIELKNTTMRP